MSASTYYVAIHHGVDETGYIAYDEGTGEAKVSLADPVWQKKVEDYLRGRHMIAHATGLDTYEEVEVSPLASLAALKLALTRMWDAIDVQVDWSRPVESK